MEREKGSKKETKNQRIMVKQNKVVYPCDLKGSLAAIGWVRTSRSFVTICHFSPGSVRAHAAMLKKGNEKDVVIWGWVRTCIFVLPENMKTYIISVLCNKNI